MGFFGFLKKDSKEKIEAPKTPGGEPEAPLSSMPTDGPQLPLPPSDSQPTDVLDEFPPPPGNDFSEADFMPSDGSAQGMSQTILPPLGASSTMSPVPEADSSLPTIGGMEPQPDASSLPENAPELPDLPPAPAAPPSEELRRLTVPPSSAEEVSSPETPSPSERETDSGVESSDDLPDFTDDDIAAAKALMKPKPVTPQEPLPSFKDAEELHPPQLEVRGALYVPATSYQGALEILKQFRVSVHEGETQLKKLTTSVTTHKEKFQQYAQSLNEIQESLITMDNMLMQAR